MDAEDKLFNQDRGLKDITAIQKLLDNQPDRKFRLMEVSTDLHLSLKRVQFIVRSGQLDILIHKKNNQDQIDWIKSLK